jgi:hypothetical protein
MWRVQQYPTGELTRHRQLSEGQQVGGLWLRRQHLSVCQGALSQHRNLFATHNRLLQRRGRGKGVAEEGRAVR